MDELKACPFCGGKNIFVDGYNHAAGKRWRVVCLDCMATVDDGTTQQKYRAIEAWNHRAEPENKCAICGIDLGPVYCPKCYKAVHAEPENKPLTCEGCVNNGCWENEVEYGYPSPCTGCKRRASDNYAQKPEQEEK